tara:strand:- start:816 stop:1745 length:930 start_codon:yes stop_codon:yes gene_type:complete
MNFDFSSVKILLIGDFMIDRYIIGKSTRMSPEAPVPVVIPQNEYTVPGGAGNVAMNLCALGAQVTCVGYMGNDKDGIDLMRHLQKENIDCNNLELISSIRTTSKTRFICNDTHIMRLDVEEKLENLWKPKSIESLEYGEYDIILLSDYNKGVLNNQWFNEINHKRIFVDPKKNDFSFYSNANIITPNFNELQRASQIKIKDDKSIEKACKIIIKNSNIKYVIAKKGNKGMTIVGRNNFVKNIDPYKVKNPDVTGAGDTVIAALSTVYAKTNDIEISAQVANAAASIVVSKVGTSIVSIDDLKNFKTNHF